jgi:hypothetical protein
VTAGIGEQHELREDLHEPLSAQRPSDSASDGPASQHTIGLVKLFEGLALVGGQALRTAVTPAHWLEIGPGSWGMY